MISSSEAVTSAMTIRQAIDMMEERDWPEEDIETLYKATALMSIFEEHLVKEYRSGRNK